MNLSSYRCRIEKCDFKTDSKDEKVWDSHYQTEHGFSIRNTCRKCGKRFVAVKDYAQGKESDFKAKLICNECSETGIEYRNGRWYQTSKPWKNTDLSPLQILVVDEVEKL